MGIYKAVDELNVTSVLIWNSASVYWSLKSYIPQRHVETLQTYLVHITALQNFNTVNASYRIARCWKKLLNDRPLHHDPAAGGFKVSIDFKQC
jgi:hypothetical protein